MRILASLAKDVRLQVRYGFYWVYLVVCGLYVAILHLLPTTAAELLRPYVLFSDPAILGLFIVGAFLLFERGDGTLESLFVTPLRTGEYLWSKAISLTLLALVTSAGIAVATAGLDLRPHYLFLGVVLTSLIFIFVGIAIATRCRTFMIFVVISGLGTGVFTLPLLDYFGILRSRLFFLLPTQGSLVLLAGAFSPEAPAAIDVLLSLTTLAVWGLAAYVWAHRWFERYVVGRVGATP